MAPSDPLKQLPHLAVCTRYALIGDPIVLPDIEPWAGWKGLMAVEAECVLPGAVFPVLNVFSTVGAGFVHASEDP